MVTSRVHHCTTSSYYTSTLHHCNTPVQHITVLHLYTSFMYYTSRVHHCTTSAQYITVLHQSTTSLYYTSTIHHCITSVHYINVIHQNTRPLNHFKTSLQEADWVKYTFVFSCSKMCQKKITQLLGISSHRLCYTTLRNLALCSVITLYSFLGGYLRVNNMYRNIYFLLLFLLWPFVPYLTPMHFNALYWTKHFQTALKCTVALHYTALQCRAVQCNAVQCSAVYHIAI